MAETSSSAARRAMQLVRTRIGQVVIANEKRSPQTILAPCATPARMCVYRNRCMGLTARTVPTRKFLSKSSHTCRASSPRS